MNGVFIIGIILASFSMCLGCYVAGYIMGKEHMGKIMAKKMEQIIDAINVHLDEIIKKQKRQLGGDK